MTKKTRISILLLAFIFLFGFFLRVYRLNLNIPELYSDEVGHYYFYNALKSPNTTLVSKLFFLPFTFTWIFGLNPFGVRVASVLFGSLTIIAGYYFAKTISKQTGTNLYLRIALVYSALMAVLPWNFSISRLGHTHVPIIVLTALLHLFLYIKSKTNLEKLASFIPFLIGSYYYPNLLLMSPLILLLPIKEIFFGNKSRLVQNLLLFFAFGSVCLGLLIFKYEVFSKTARGLDLAIWNDVNTTYNTDKFRGLSQKSDVSIFSLHQNPEIILNKVFFNRLSATAQVFTKNYFSFFSPNFLFLKGDNILRHSTGMVGSFYLFLLPFMLYGGYLFYNNQTTRNKIIFTTWLLASPIPAAITKDGDSYLLRAITLMPLLTYFCSLGIVSFLSVINAWRYKAVYLLVLGTIAFSSIFYYFFGYFHVYPGLAKDSFEYGFKNLSDFQLLHPKKLLITWEDKYPYLQFCFWQNRPIAGCKFEDTNTREVSGESRADLPISNLLFSLPKNEIDLNKIVNKYQPDYIAVSSRYFSMYPNFFTNKKLAAEIKNPDDTVSFRVYLLD